MSFVQDDGGRAAAGYKGEASDCVCRAIAIATGKPYQEVYDALFARVKAFAETSRSRAARRAATKGSSPRNGINKAVWSKYLESLGWVWVPTMQIGSGCKVHLKADELPQGKLIVRVSKHIVAVVDGVIHDTHDCSRDGTRCVYGYFHERPNC